MPRDCVLDRMLVQGDLLSFLDAISGQQFIEKKKQWYNDSLCRIDVEKNTSPI